MKRAAPYEKSIFFDCISVF